MSTIPRAELCPLCRRPSVADHAPFCSRGCKDRDLLNWLGEAYRMPALDDGAEDETGLDSEGDPRL